MRQHFLNHLESHESPVYVFTDGSKADAGVGFGDVFPDLNYFGALPPNVSVFTSELYVILTTTKRIVHYQNCSFTILVIQRVYW